MNTPIILILSPPGGGKETQGELVKKMWGLSPFSTGEALREHVKLNTTLGLEAKNYMSQGLDLPDELITPMVYDRLMNTQRPKVGYLLDGFPRSIGQAETLASWVNDDFEVKGAIYLDVPDCEVIGRQIGRAEALRELGKEYRPQDLNPVVQQQRLNIFRTETIPVIEMYSQQDLLHIIKDPNFEKFENIREINKQVNSSLRQILD